MANWQWFFQWETREWPLLSGTRFVWIEPHCIVGKYLYVDAWISVGLWVGWYVGRIRFNVYTMCKKVLFCQTESNDNDTSTTVSIQSSFFLIVSFLITVQMQFCETIVCMRCFISTNKQNCWRDTEKYWIDHL